MKGAGLHNLPNIATQHVAWPAELGQQPSWIRFTLSERESNKPLQFGSINYGDGRGYDRPFRTGETEDHRLQPAGGPQDGPDMAVDLAGKIWPADPGADVRAADTSMVQEIDSLNFAKIVFKIGYENLGSRTASGARIEFQIPEKLRGAGIDLLRAPGAADDKIERKPDAINLALPDLEPGAVGTVTLGWTGCLTCTVASNVGTDEYTAVARVRLEGDVDLNNNEDSITLRGLLSSPMVGMLLDYSDDGMVDHLVRGKALTCRDQPRLGGRAEPGMPVEIVIDGTVVATVNADANGRFSHTPTTLSAGDHRILARYPSQASAATGDQASFDPGYLSPYLRLYVDPSLPFDPVSLHFTDSQERVVLPVFGRDGGSSLAGLSFDLQLRSGESYRVEVDGCPGNADVQGYRIFVGDQQAVRLTDENGDGRHEGAFVYEPAVAAATGGTAQSITLVSVEASTESVVQGVVSSPTSAVVRNRDSGQPLPGAGIEALSPQGNDESGSFEPWDGAGLGQLNPVQSDANGAFSLHVEPGVFRLYVVAERFQPYRTGDIDVAGNSLATDVSLAPAIVDGADHTIYVDESGFKPSLITVKPGSAIEWINVGLEDHAVTGSGQDSGLLETGEGYKARFMTTGTFEIADDVEPQNMATIVVSDEVVVEMRQVYLPMVAGR